MLRSLFFFFGNRIVFIGLTGGGVELDMIQTELLLWDSVYRFSVFSFKSLDLGTGSWV